MPTDIETDDLPPTPFELDQLRNAKVTRDNDKRERVRVRRTNQAKGFAAPKVGQTYHVQLDSSITRRTRSGIRFEKNNRIAVTVVSDEEFEAVKARHPTAPIVTVLGAEYILEDSALHVFEAPMPDEDVQALRQRNSDLEDEARLAREEAARLRVQLAERTARMTAPESTDGRPTRIPAAQAARAAATTKAPAAPEFGVTASEPENK